MFGGAERVFIGVDIDQIDKMAPRGVKSAQGAIELNRHFGAETDLLNLQCGYVGHFCQLHAGFLIFRYLFVRRFPYLVTFIASFFWFKNIPT